MKEQKPQGPGPRILDFYARSQNTDFLCGELDTV